MTGPLEEVTVTGPLVTGDPAKIMLANIARHMAELTEQGAEEARRGYASGGAGRQLVRLLHDRVADHVVGRVTARPSEGGRRWFAHGVIQVYNEGYTVAQGRSLMAAAAILEGRQNVIRRVTRSLGQKLRSIDLAKGLE